MAKEAGFKIVLDEEQIARILFAPSMVAGDKVAPSAFFLVNFKDGTPEDYLSVWRLSLRIPSTDTVTFPPRTPGDTLYGYAELNVGGCRRAAVRDYRCEVRVNPKSPNQYHAGIFYSDGKRAIVGACYEPQFLMLATRLAAQSILVAI